MAGAVPEALKKKVDRIGKGEAEGRASEQRKRWNARQILSQVPNSIKLRLNRIRD
jgi:hypothetical protein